MSVTFRVGDLGNSSFNARTITAIAAGGLVTYSGGDPTTPVGRTFEIAGSSDPDNNRIGYTCVAVNTLTNVLTLRPAPNTGASTLGTVTMKNPATARTLSDTGIDSIVQIGTTNRYIIEVGGANFLTNGIRPNDRAVITGHATVTNNGAWFVCGMPLDETRIVVRPPDGGATTLTAAGVSGTLEVRIGIHRLTITNEAALSWDYVRTNATALTGPGGIAMGSGTGADFIRKESLAGARTLYTIDGFGFIDLVQSSASVWTSENEVVINGRGVSAGGTAGDNITGVPLRFRSTDSTAPTIIRLGRQAGNRYSASFGSAWFLMNVGTNDAAGGSDNTPLEIFASVFDGGAVQWRLWGGSKSTAAILRDNVAISDGCTIESTTFLGSNAAVVEGSGDMANVLIASQTASSLFLGGEAGGFLVSDDVPNLVDDLIPAFAASGLVTFTDPRVDIDLNDGRFQGAFAKQFTFNPRFTAQILGSPLPVPVQVNVQIYQINETTFEETLLFDGVSDATTGLINNDLGIEVIRQSGNYPAPPIGLGSETLYATRIVTSGGGFPTKSHTIQLFSAVLQRDYPVDEDELGGLWTIRVQQ